MMTPTRADPRAMQASFLVHLLVLLSTLNAVYTFWRKKHYRFFESNIDAVPSTPSAHRVRVDSSPVASSPLLFLSNILGTQSAQSRAHPDPQRDVWEVAVWDPLPVCLRLFCYFSPGHVLIYWLFLPVSPADPRPSITIATAIFLALLLSGQMSLLQSHFSQQIKDSALISKEVLHEYDTKFVRPRTQPLYRDVGTQFSEQASFTVSKDTRYNTVDTYPPMVVVNRGFKPNPNPNYTQHTDPDGAVQAPTSSAFRYPQQTPSYIPSTQALRTPAPFQELSSPLKPPMTAVRQPIFRPTGGGDGGSLGVYSHAASPLRKSASTNFDQPRRTTGALSPNKRLSTPATSAVAGGGSGLSQRLTHLKSDRARRESGRF